MKIANRRGFIFILSSIACIVMLNALRPVHGQSQESDLKKQVETLSKTVEDQKKQLDSLRKDLNFLKSVTEKFAAQQIQFDNGIKETIAKQEQRLNTNGKEIGALGESARQQDFTLRQHSLDSRRQGEAILLIDRRLRAKGM